MKVRTSRLVALVAAGAALFVGAPANADPVDDLQRAAIVSYDLHFQATDLLTGQIFTHDIENQTHVGGDPVPAELYEGIDLAHLAVAGVSAAKKCQPGGWDLWAWIDGKNFLNETVVRFHTDTEFYYDCKKVTAIPFVSVYGSDYHYFWRYDKTLVKEKHGVGTKTGTAVGAGSFAQCMNYGFGDACIAHSSFKITWHMFANGTFSAKGH